MKIVSQTGSPLNAPVKEARPAFVPASAARGFTVLEILIAVLIIGVLAAVLVPVLTNRVHEARLAACLDELERIADAQERAAVQMGYYLRLYALDDLPGGDNLPLDHPDNRVDGIRDERLNTNFYSFPEQMFIMPESNRFLTPARASVVYNTMAYETNYAWKGPFLNIQRDEKPHEHDGTSFPRRMHGIPNDPWGNDYLLFLSDGLVLEPTPSVDGAGRVSNVVTWDGRSYQTNVFDRPTILSLGPDGMPGDGTPNTTFGEGDDLYRSFGHRGVTRP